MRRLTISLLVAGLAVSATAVFAQSYGLGQGQGQGQGRGPRQMQMQGQAGPQMADFLVQWDMNGDGRVTPDDVATRRGDLFEMFDLDGSGALDADEQANMAQTIAAQEETNHEGHGGGQRQGQGLGQGLGQGHGLGQAQGQGRGPGRRFTSPGQMIHAAMTPGFADADRDGRITAREWVEATPRLFAQLDANGDGQVDAADFGRDR